MTAQPRVTATYAYLILYMPRPYLYLNLSLAQTYLYLILSLLWRGNSAEHLCWRRSAVRWAWGRTNPFCRAPATTPSPSEPGPSLHLRPLERYSSGARGTTAIRANAMELPVNGLIDTTFGCYPSSKAADAMPKGAPSVGTHVQHATLLMHLKCCNFQPTGPFGTIHSSCWVRHGWDCRRDSTLPLAVTNDIRHIPPCGQLLDLTEAAGTSAAQ
jgi:hypothetical protein